MKNIFNIINKNILLSRFWEFFPKKKKSVKKMGPLITISREKGSGGRIIAQLVVRKLGRRWRFYHKDLIEKIAKEAKLEKELIEEIDEQKRSAVEELIFDLFGKKYASFNSYYQGLVRVLSEIGQRGYAVIVGRGANFLFPKALNVRIICQMEQRIAWEMKYEKLSEAKAIEIIQESDKKRREFVKTLFYHDIKKAHHYDLVIRTGPDLNIETAADLIVMAAKRRFKI